MKFMQSRIFVIGFLILGSLMLSLTMVRSGLTYTYGMGFWGPNGHDGIWHIALSESLVRESLGMPIFSGERLKNYHIGFDLFVSFLHKVTGIPIVNIYFQLMPVLIAFGIGFGTFYFVYKWKGLGASFWSLFFSFFGGSFGYLVSLYRSRTLDGESVFWSQQAVSTLVNPPFALSLVIMLTVLIILERKLYIKRHFFLFLIILIGLSVQIKVYSGILILGALFMTGIYKYLLNRDFTYLRIWLFSIILAIFFFMPLNRGSSSLIFIKPFWFLETMMILTDRVGWMRYGEAMINYKSAQNFLKMTPAYFLAFLIFIIGNMGTRLLAIGNLKRFDIKKIYPISMILFLIIVGGIFLPTFFLQKGTPWNTIQFFYYSNYFTGIYAGIYIDKFLSQKRNKYRNIFAVFLIVIATIPTTYSTLKNHYLTKNPPSMLSRGEIEALKFLSEQPKGIVFTYPFDNIAALEAERSAPRPLYLYTSTAYVSAFSKNHVFLEDEINLDIMGYDWGKRKIEIIKFYDSLDHKFVWNFLRENNIDYIYWVKPQRARLGEEQLGIEKIYENSEVEIFGVK